MDWSKITDVILVASFAVLIVFIILGFCQWIQRKSLKKVDKQLLWLPLPLSLMAITYIIFDKFLVLNTRPDGSGEPSFPSTHVMIVTTIFFLAALTLPQYVKSKVALTIIYILMFALAVLVCVGRIFALKHWASDVVGALIFSVIFTFIYYLFIKKRSQNHA